MTGRVVIVTGEPINSPGGMEHALRELRSGFEREGLDVVVLTRDHLPGWLARPANKFVAYSSDFALSWFLGRKLRDYADSNLRAVISNGPFGWYSPQLPPAVKKVHFYHGTYRGQAKVLEPQISSLGVLKLKWWDSMVLERLSGRGKAVLCNSDQTRLEVERYFGYRGKTVWLPLDTNLFAPRDKAKARLQLGLPVEGTAGLFVGSCHPTKGFDMVRSLLEDTAPDRWYLALRGQIPKDLLALSRVRVFPNATQEQLVTLYNAADFVLCSSLYESFGYTVAEGLASGTPVIATRGGASTKLLFESSLRRLVMEDPQRVDSFRGAVKEVLRDVDFYRASVSNEIRPRIEVLMGTQNWTRNFIDTVGL